LDSTLHSAKDCRSKSGQSNLKTSKDSLFCRLQKIRASPQKLWITYC